MRILLLLLLINIVSGYIPNLTRDLATHVEQSPAIHNFRAVGRIGAIPRLIAQSEDLSPQQESQILSHAGYIDPELMQLWSSFSDLNHPSLQDYQMVEKYLSMGERPYLKVMEKSLLNFPEDLKGARWRLDGMRKFKLLGPNLEMPIFEVHDINVTQATEHRCILLFASYNGFYSEKAHVILKELRECGYSGNVLLRIGGFPNTPNGGMKLCHIPYSFKVAFLKEAQLLGYKQVLWLDTAIHPLTNLEDIFAQIDLVGFFFTEVGKLSNNAPMHLEEASLALDIPMNLHRKIPHLASAIIGLDMQNFQAISFLESWYEETEKLFPNLTWFPEELSLSVCAWRNGCEPSSWFGKIVCTENELFELFQLQQRPTIQFYLDGRR